MRPFGKQISLHRSIVLLTLLAFFSVPLFGVSPAISQNKEVFGWVERIQIREAEMPILAKLDTGADTSSIHAREVKEFEKDGEPWVQFEVRNFQGKVSEIVAPVVRVAKIKRHSGVAQRRIVIKLGLCLGEMFQEEYVSLVDRTKFEYQFLLGRSFLAGNAIVDPSAMFTSVPNCSNQLRPQPAKQSDVITVTPGVSSKGKSNVLGTNKDSPKSSGGDTRKGA